MKEFHFSLVSFCAMMKELIFTSSSRVIDVNYVKFDEVRIERFWKHFVRIFEHKFGKHHVNHVLKT